MMPRPRKVFRIEQTAAARLEPSIGTTQGELRHAEIMRELRALRAAMSAAAPVLPRAKSAAQRGEVARLTGELNLIAEAIRGDGDEIADDSREGPPREARSNASLSRIASELNAVVNGTEQATQKILAA